MLDFDTYLKRFKGINFDLFEEAQRVNKIGFINDYISYVMAKEVGNINNAPDNLDYDEEALDDDSKQIDYLQNN